jgi:hypothetical protein
MDGILGLLNLTHYSTLPIFRHSNDQGEGFHDWVIDQEDCGK